MSIDFQQVRNQVQSLGEGAGERAHHLSQLRDSAHSSLGLNANKFDFLSQRVRLIAAQYDPHLRCAMPALDSQEPLDACFPLPPAPERATVIGADGSQISPDRHAPVNYCLINTGAIQMQLNHPAPPQITVRSELLGDAVLSTPSGMISDDQVSMLRDVSERQMLSDLAEAAAPPVVTLTDGTLELWGAGEQAGGVQYQQCLQQYQDALEKLRLHAATVAGYVDKPGANLVVRLLEVAALEEAQLKEVKDFRPYLGVTDRDLFARILEPGDRSAVFAMQARGQLQYREGLKVHFFYLNVGRPGHPWLARVEVPAWVAADRQMLDLAHSVLLQQCRIMGEQGFPYILHRAHEAAVVTFEEKDQVTQMIIQEYYRRGVAVGEISHKQFAKVSGKRTRHSRR